jgi:hypothetical protein
MILGHAIGAAARSGHHFLRVKIDSQGRSGLECGAPPGADEGSRPGEGRVVKLLDGEGPMMRMYFFDVTVKVMHHDVPEKVTVYKGARAPSEHLARRLILNQFLAGGFQVVRIDRVEERCLQADGD